MRYNPSFQVLGGTSGSTDLSNDCFDIEFNDSITNAAGDFKISLDDRMGRYSKGTRAALAQFQPVIITLDGVRIFKGRIESPVGIVDKKAALVYEISGRSNFGTLVDMVYSKHVVQETAYAIVNEIIAIQNAQALSQDPVLSMGSNLADNTVKLNFLWKRQSLQEMLYDVACKLGSPVSQGGVNQFYDFWVNPYDAFYFVPTGSLNSYVDLGWPGGIEETERKFVIDAYPVKNDIWTWAMNTAAGVGLGRIPLTLQPGYAGYPEDSWTEGNAADYTAGDNIDTLHNDATRYVMGTSAIYVASTAILPNQRFYFAMQMPFPADGSKWPGQPPNNVMNTYNETSMSESMGQLAAMSYFLWLAVQGTWTHWVEVVDIYGNVAQSQMMNALSQDLVHPSPGSGLPAGWQQMTIAFGPDSNFVLVTGTFFDWASVAQIRFSFSPQNVLVATAQSLWFDGFQFVKPLVVNTKQAGATTRRTYTQVESGILTYLDAVNYGQATLENMMQPQQYDEIKNIGRNDIPAGYAFTSEAKSLVARMIKYKFTKPEGWLIDMKGWEAT